MTSMTAVANPSAQRPHRPGVRMAAGAVVNRYGDALRAYLLSVHGIAHHNSVTWLHKSLNEGGMQIDRSTVHRRQQGNPPWTEELFKEIATALGASASEILSYLPREKAAKSESTTRAKMAFGRGQYVEVVLEPGKSNPPFVAVATPDGTYLLYESQHVPPDVDGPRIPVFEIRGISAPVFRVAILEDDATSLAGMEAELTARGMKVQGFKTIAALRGVLADPPDAFVIDYFIGKQTAREIVEQIRGAYPRRPIWLLSGLVLEQFGRDNTIDFVDTYNLTFQSKPVDPKLFAGEVQRRLFNEFMA